MSAALRWGFEVCKACTGTRNPMTGKTVDKREALPREEDGHPRGRGKIKSVQDEIPRK